MAAWAAIITPASAVTAAAWAVIAPTSAVTVAWAVITPANSGPITTIITRVVITPASSGPIALEIIILAIARIREVTINRSVSVTR